MGLEVFLLDVLGIVGDPPNGVFTKGINIIAVKARVSTMASMMMTV